MGVCYHCAATGLPCKPYTCGSRFQANGGIYPAGGATHSPQGPQSHVPHQALTVTPALSARMELPCAPPSTMNAPPFCPTQAGYTHDLLVWGAVAGGAGNLSGYSAWPNPVHTGRQLVSAPVYTIAGGVAHLLTPHAYGVSTADPFPPQATCDHNSFVSNTVAGDAEEFRAILRRQIHITLVANRVASRRRRWPEGLPKCQPLTQDPIC